MAVDLPQDLRPGEPVLVSACLLGEPVRWHGGSNLDAELVAALRERSAVIVPVCPEVLGGLTVPREPAEPPRGDGRDVLAGRARVLARGGADVTAEFLSGARHARDLATRLRARYAFLKERSPSCGVCQTHSGGGLAAGPGVATAALQEAGVAVLPAAV